MRQPNAIRRVFILGMDGAGNFVQQAHTPHLDRWFNRGAYTYEAQAELPTISAECWGSVLHGVTPDKHGLTNDKAASESYPTDSPFPSLFRLVRDRFPEAKLASFTGWNPINSGIIEENLGVHKVSLPDAELVPALLGYLDENPDVRLLFLQLDEPDGSGHRYGYGEESREYLAAIGVCDERIGSVLERLEKQGLVEDSLIILLTDHGGGGADKHSHGSDHPMDRNVFWGCIGPGIKKGRLSGTVTITNTAAIAALALGITIPEYWDARIPEGLLEGGENNDG
ncbi:alkaline phosphatase family protein [Cohnella herbarum]|uniref:Nucleotide pyrophosphatase n=1 Tax=Cohnella herbarum TaxID=2728023 RepID=A0A7Z2ZMZ7_9BACL|nr:alkaline phosphatase family protein [Cohnella herbarum]QJD85549.1 nucleotide pyrophosphatase [Cohnella herbarum]